MFLKKNNVMFLFIMILGTMISMSSSSWLNAWMGLELNLMSIIPILISSGSYEMTSSSIKYFLIQAMASMFMVLIFIITYNMSVLENLNINNEVMLMSLVMKSGTPPLHFWLPQVVEACNMMQNMLILSWQKIAPLALMSYLVSEMIFFVIMVSSLVGSVGGFNQNSIKKILVYSSMAHMAWMMMSMLISQEIWLSYFLIYNVSLILMCAMMEKTSIEKISDLSGTKMSWSVKYIFMMNMLSMAGLPPFLGFFGKIIVIMNMIFSLKMFILMGVMLVASLVSLFFYMRVCTSSILVGEKNKYLKKMILNNSNMAMFTIVMNLLGPLMVYLT